jgi:hypothetical protein
MNVYTSVGRKLQYVSWNYLSISTNGDQFRSKGLKLSIKLLRLYLLRLKNGDLILLGYSRYRRWCKFKPTPLRTVGSGYDTHNRLLFD